MIGANLKHRYQALLPVLAVLFALIAVNQFFWNRLGRIDLTSAGVYSLSPDTKRILKNITAPVTVIWFYDLRNKSMVDAKALLDQYAHENPLIKVFAIDPLVHPSEARKYNIQFAGSAVLESGQKKLVINGGSETDFTNALIRISRENLQTVCFTTGHLESNPFSLKTLDDLEDHSDEENIVSRVELHEKNGMGMARDALETLGYKVVQLNLLHDSEAINDCTTVVIAAPKKTITEHEVSSIGEYLHKGGKVFAMLDPGSSSGLSPLLEKYGIGYDGDEILDPASHYRSDPGSPAVSDYPRHKITRNLQLTFFPGASSFSPAEKGIPSGIRINPIVMSSDSARSQSSNKSGVKTLMVLATPAINAENMGTRSSKAALLVVGDGDFAKNTHFSVLGNSALFLNSVNFLAEQEDLINITPRNYEQTAVELTNGQMRATFFVSAILFPLLAFVLGMVLWWRRR
jgi:ABC-type uncharacterized transport system involved in gliding motility auxiliary subunit